VRETHGQRFERLGFLDHRFRLSFSRKSYTPTVRQVACVALVDSRAAPPSIHRHPLRSRPRSTSQKDPGLLRGPGLSSASMKMTSRLMVWCGLGQWMNNGKGQCDGHIRLQVAQPCSFAAEGPAAGGSRGRSRSASIGSATSKTSTRISRQSSTLQHISERTPSTVPVSQAAETFYAHLPDGMLHCILIDEGAGPQPCTQCRTWLPRHADEAAMKARELRKSMKNPLKARVCSGD
jgi:hypothetical protein